MKTVLTISEIWPDGHGRPAMLPSSPIASHISLKVSKTFSQVGRLLVVGVVDGDRELESVGVEVGLEVGVGVEVEVEVGIEVEVEVGVGVEVEVEVDVGSQPLRNNSHEC